MNLPLNEYYGLLARYLRPQWPRVLLLALLLFGSIGLRLYAPQIIRDFIDMAATGATTEMLTRVGALFLLVTVLNQIVRTATAYVTEDVKWRATNWLRDDLSAHCLRLDMSFHNEHTPGAMIERIDGDVTELSNFFSQFVLRVFGNVFFLIGVIVLLFAEDWRFGATFALLSVIMLLAMSRTVELATPHWKERRQRTSEMYGLLEEWLGGTEDIRASGGRSYVLQRCHRAIYNVYRATRRAWMYGEITWGMTILFFSLTTAIALGLGGALYLNGTITIGTVYLVLHYSTMLHRPLEELSHEFKDLQAATASITRIRELFEVQPAVKTPRFPHKLPDGALAVEFDSVTFAYHEDKPILHDVSFRLEPGEVMGLLGRTGSGKTTITRLLFRLYDPTRGAAWLGDEELRSVAVDEVRSHVGMVTQDVQLFRASVRDNLTFFDTTMRDADIIKALEILGLDRWYGALPAGLDTLLETGGRGLSAGEAQLLAFTRVFLKNPGLVILDEASSRLDPVTEQLIEHAIDRLLADRSAIIVAHRLATVQRADRIVILQDGEIVENGERAALLADSDSRFSQLLRTGMEEVLA